ncbi:MAG TPA: DUF3108 domain-containing protein [Bryobacteraceae bacterium]|nr:DUF3108 domain-containing protein [Bryobacteraceae bacterium]
MALLAVPPFSLAQAKPAEAKAVDAKAAAGKVVDGKVADGVAVPFPSAETLTYNIEWRLIYAGAARVTLEPAASTDGQKWHTSLHVESGGMVSKLYKLEDTYNVDMVNQFCAVSTHLDSREGKRHKETVVDFDHNRGKAIYTERDLVRNATIKTAEVAIPACASDVIGGLLKLRTMHLEPGQSAQIPLSDGKKSAMARIEAQDREQIKVTAGTYNTVRYEAFLFNGVLYARKAELYVWLTDDARRLPVQIRARMNFPIGSITFTLDKAD